MFMKTLAALSSTEKKM